MLDSAPVRVDGTGAEALTESLERAQQLDQIGCHRLWFTEHHLAPDVASTSPLTMVGQVAARTTNLRLGAGGVMIRNHPPLVIAEQAATLSLLYPDRIDLESVGPAVRTTRPTRGSVERSWTTTASTRTSSETIHLLGATRCQRGGGVRPGELTGDREVRRPPGLGPGRGRPRRPGGHRERDHRLSRVVPCPAAAQPWVVLCLPVVIAQSDADARWWFRSVQRRYLDRLRTGGAPMVLPADADLDWSASESYRVDGMLEAAIVGSPGTVKLREVTGGGPLTN